MVEQARADCGGRLADRSWALNPDFLEMVPLAAKRKRRSRCPSPKPWSRGVTDGVPALARNARVNAPSDAD